MKRKVNSNKAALIVLITIISLFVLGLPFYFQFEHRRDIRSQIEKENNLMIEYRDTISSLNELKKGLENGKNAILMYDQLLPTNSDKSVLIDFFQELALDINIKFTKITFDPDVPKDGYIEVPMIIICSGKYNDLMSLIDNLSKGRRLICIDGINMKRSNENSLEISMELTARAFYKAR